MSDRKLKFELVPDSCWYSNLRSLLSKKEWDYIRHDAYDRANGKCMICGRKVTRLEAHERWEYDMENAVQKLTDVIAVCSMCHSAIHIGRSQLIGRGEIAENWYMKVNGVKYYELRADLGEANELHKKRNLIPEWKLDLSYLKRYIPDK